MKYAICFFPVVGVFCGVLIWLFASLGTILNVAGIVLGGIIGLFCGKLITPRIQSTLLKANGVCVLFLGISGTLQQTRHCSRRIPWGGNVRRISV